MKKELYRVSFVLALIVVFVSVSPVAMAGTVGSPTATVAQGSFLMGAEIDFWERDMEDEFGDEGEVEGTKILVKGTFGVSDTIDVFGKIGMAGSEFNLAGFPVETDMDIAFGIGGKVNVYDQGQTKAGIVAQVLLWSGEDTSIPGAPGGTVEIDATEFDIAFGGSYKVSEEFNWYGGLIYSMVSGELTVSGPGGSGSFDVDEADPIGIFLGGEFAISPQAKAGLELRLINETSFTFMANFTF
jgi:hypothetical protein